MKLKTLFFALRPKQWIKNLFLVLPLIFGGKLFSFPENLQVFFGCLVFSLASGAVYLINDTLDLEKDLTHPTKKLRPLPSGKISVKEASVFAVCLIAAAIIFAGLLNLQFMGVVILYVTVNFLYSQSLKHMVIIDVCSIGFFFLLRVLAGCFLAEVAMSHWILFMTVLLALFLGFNKRRQELKLLGDKAVDHRTVLAKYDRYFIDQMIGVITASIVVTYMLYTVDARTVQMFKTDHLIYTIPFVYYGIFRYLYLMHRISKEGDPSRILLMDRPLQLNIAAWGFVAVAVIYFGL